MKWSTAKGKLLENEETRNYYNSVDLAFEISKMITDARIARGLTQQELATRLETQQPAVARLESGSRLPSLKLLQKIAEVFDTQLLPPRFEFQELTPTYTLNYSFMSSSNRVRARRPRIATTAKSAFPTNSNAYSFAKEEEFHAIIQ